MIERDSSRFSEIIKDIKLLNQNKVTLPIKKAERGTHIKLVTVHRGGKTFKRKQRVGRKEEDKVSEKESVEWQAWQNYYKEKLFRPSVSPHEDYYSQSILIATSQQHAKDLIRKYQMADPSSMGIDLVADFESLYKRTKGDVPKKSNMHIDNLIKIKSLEDSGIPGLVGGMHEGETYIVKFKDGSQAIHKTMLMGDVIGEVGAYETSKILNWDIVPETIQCDYGKGEGSCQKWVDGNEPYDGFDDGAPQIEEKYLNDLSKIFIMDMILGNYDRHSGNIIIDKNDKVWAIDNEMIGKLNNAELHIESLEQFAKEGEGSFVPMISIMKNNFGNYPRMYQKFKNHVDENLIRVRKHQNKIIKYWSQYKDSKFLNTGIPIKESIKNIEKNINYLNKYYGEL